MRRSRGFTLVEVMVVVAIMAVIGLASATVVDSMMRTSEQSDDALKRMSQLQTAMLRLDNDMRSIVARSNVTGTYLFYDDQRLAFVRNGWFNPGGVLPRSELQPVAYLLRDGDLVREYYHFVDMTTGSDPETEVLIADVEAFSARFLPQPQYESLEALNQAWTTDWDGSSTLPYAIELTIETEKWGALTRIYRIAGGTARPVEAASGEGSSEEESDPSNAGGGAL